MTDERARKKGRDRAVVRGALATASTRLITASTSYLTLAIAARVLHRDEFGFVAVLLSFWLILTMFDLGVGGALTTRVAQGHARDDLAEIRANVNDALGAMTVIGVVIAVGGTLSAIALPWQHWIGGSLPASTVTRGLIIAFVLSGVTMPASVGTATISAMQRFTAAKWCEAAAGISTVVATAAVAPTHPPADVMLFVVLGSPVVILLGFTAWVYFRVLHKDGSGASVPSAGFRNMLLTSGWYALYTTSNTIGIGTGTVIVGATLGPADAGIFAVASRLFSPIITVVAASGALLRPGMTEAIARGDVEWARSRYRRGLVTVIAVSSTLSIALIAAGPWLAKIWVGEALVPSRGLLAAVAAFSVAVAVASQTNVLLMAVERIRAGASLSACAAIVSVFVSILLCRAIGVSGAALGALAGCMGILLPGIALVARDVLRTLSPMPELSDGHVPQVPALGDEGGVHAVPQSGGS